MERKSNVATAKNWSEKCIVIRRRERDKIGLAAAVTLVKRCGGKEGECVKVGVRGVARWSEDSGRYQQSNAGEDQCQERRTSQKMSRLINKNKTFALI